VTSNPTPQHATTALTDITTIASWINPAIANLQQNQAGWPTSTPGAAPAEAHTTACAHPDCTHDRPCPTHDTEPVTLTPTERCAATHDPATADLDQLHTDLRQLATIAARAARIVTRWAHPGLNRTQIADQLAAIDAVIWCSNCTRYGRHEPREEDRTECTFCRQFRRDYKTAAPKEIWDARDARNGRIDQTTIQRILRQVKQRRQAESDARRAAQKAARNTPATNLQET